MKRSGPDTYTFQYASAAELNRATLDLEGITLETRGVIGAFYPWARLFWDEVQAVYVWEARDWTAIAVGGLVAVLIWSFGLLFVREGDWKSQLLCGVAGLAVMGGGAWWGSRFRPRRWIQLRAVPLAVRFHTRDEEALLFLLARLGSTVGGIQQVEPTRTGNSDSSR